MHSKALSSLIFLSLVVLSTQAFAAGSGSTANGCTYKVVNGEYYYDCEAKKPSPYAPVPSAIILNVNYLTRCI